MTHGSCHVVRRSCLTPAIAELTGSNGEAGTHVRIAEGEDRTVLVDTLSNDEFEHAVLILCDTEIRHVARRRIELRRSRQNLSDR